MILKCTRKGSGAALSARVGHSHRPPAPEAGHGLGAGGTCVRPDASPAHAGELIAPAAAARPRRSPPPGTSILGRTPTLTDKDTIVLADFDNQTGDPVFDDTLRQGLSVELQQSPFLSLISDRQVQQTAGADGTAERGAADFGSGSANLRANGKCRGSGRLDRQPWKPIRVGPARQGLRHRKHSRSGADPGGQERRRSELPESRSFVNSELGWANRRRRWKSIRRRSPRRRHLHSRP